MLQSISLSVIIHNSVAWKAHDGPISFIKKFPYINDDATIIATGSHDKSLKFWTVPADWLEFKKQAKAKLAKDKSEKESTTTTSQITEPEKPKEEAKPAEPKIKKPKEPKEEVKPSEPEPQPELPKPKKKKEPVVPQEVAEPPKAQEEVVHDLDEDDAAKKQKKKSEKANLFDSEGEDDKEFN